MFADLHPDLKFRDGRLTLVEVARGNRPATGSAPGGLVLVPLVLGPPYVLIKLRTTTELARASSVTPSAVSQHLRVLRDSGLVARERYGRSVLYVTTERGMALLEPGPAI